jgi:hypothetical protein
MSKDPSPPSSVPTIHHGSYIAGAALIIIGTIALISQFPQTKDYGYYFPFILSLVFIGWGIAARVGSLLVPGGILAGIGIDAILELQHITLYGISKDALYVFILGLGFLSIIPLSRLFTKDTYTWAYAPGLFLVIVGIAIQLGGPPLQLVQFVSNYIWPLTLIGLGGLLIWQRSRHDRKPTQTTTL